ncbi:MAG TPA: YndJ family transporter [Opitutaceae bacterium]|nr:YndJ family transporter [Opitutaceae bacterium]
MNGNRNAAIGGLFCIAFVVLRVPGLGDDAWARALLLFAALVLVPLVLDLLGERNEARLAARWLAWVRAWQLPAVGLLALACVVREGAWAAALAFPWLALTWLLAAIGVVRAVRHGWARPLGRLAGDIALLFAAVGGLWTFFDRAGLRPLGLDPAIVTLTAVHFHYAGLLLALFAGLALRARPESRFAARVVVGVVLAVPAVALGITSTQLGWGAALEAAAGVALALTGLMLAGLHLAIALRPGPRTARVLLGIAGASLAGGMILAACYALRSIVAPIPALGIPQMRMIHGTINALGFGLCGTLGWRAFLAQTEPAAKKNVSAGAAP